METVHFQTTGEFSFEETYFLALLVCLEVKLDHMHLASDECWC